MPAEERVAFDCEWLAAAKVDEHRACVWICNRQTIGKPRREEQRMDCRRPFVMVAEIKIRLLHFRGLERFRSGRGIVMLRDIAAFRPEVAHLRIQAVLRRNELLELDT